MHIIIPVFGIEPSPSPPQTREQQSFALPLPSRNGNRRYTLLLVPAPKNEGLTSGSRPDTPTSSSSSYLLYERTKIYIESVATWRWTLSPTSSSVLYSYNLMQRTSGPSYSIGKRQMPFPPSPQYPGGGGGALYRSLLSSYLSIRRYEYNTTQYNTNAPM